MGEMKLEADNFCQKRRRYRFRVLDDSGQGRVAIKGFSVGSYAGSAGLFVAKMFTVAATRRVCSAPAWQLLRSLILTKGLPKAVQSKIRKMLGRVHPIAQITTGAHDAATCMALPYLALHVASLAMQLHAATRQQRMHPINKSKRSGLSAATKSEHVREDPSEHSLVAEMGAPCQAFYRRLQPGTSGPGECMELTTCALEEEAGMAAEMPSWVSGDLEWIPHEVLREPPWSHVVHWHGFDDAKRPVIFVRPAAMMEHFAPDQHARFISVLLSSMEYAWHHLLLRLPDGSRSTVCALIDAQGLGLRKLPNMDVVKQGMALLNQHYAGCAGRLLVVNVPPVLSYVMAALKRFMDPVTRTKLHVMSRGAGCTAALKEMLGMCLPVAYGGACQCVHCDMSYHAEDEWHDAHDRFHHHHDVAAPEQAEALALRRYIPCLDAELLMSAS